MSKSRVGKREERQKGPGSRKRDTCRTGIASNSREFEAIPVPQCTRFRTGRLFSLSSRFPILGESIVLLVARNDVAGVDAVYTIY
jgi:hypothetical protein